MATTPQSFHSKGDLIFVLSFPTQISSFVVERVSCVGSLPLQLSRNELGMTHQNEWLIIVDDSSCESGRLHILPIDASDQQRERGVFREAKQSSSKYLGVFSMREICGLLIQLLRVAELGNLPDCPKTSPEPACSIQI